MSKIIAPPVPVVPFGEHEIIHDQQLDDTDPIGNANEVAATQGRYIASYSQAKLDAIYSHLWSAGIKGYISSLHHQKVLCREIILTECPDLHLIWFSRTIYIQPLRNSLLNKHFLTTVVLPSPTLHAAVLGFLYSYTRLIVHQSDLDLARELHLVSKDVTWKAWFDFRAAVLDSLDTTTAQMHRRYEYGELRLARLNFIYRLTFRGVMYFTTHRGYATYFTEFFAAGITLFAFVTVALTAMQVVVGMKDVSDALVQTSYRFSVAVLVVVAAFGAAVALLFFFMFLFNTVRTVWATFFVRKGKRRRE